MAELYAMCGDACEWVVDDSFRGKSSGTYLCALPALHTDPYHATADGRHQWSVDAGHQHRVTQSLIADIERLKAAHQLQYEECMRQVARAARLEAALRKIVSAACEAPMSDGEAEGWYGYVPEFIADECLMALNPGPVPSGGA